MHLDDAASYADHKKLPLGRISVDVSHAKSHAKDCEECTESERSSGARIDRFDRIISIEGEVPEDLRGKIAEISRKCPVHRTLEAVAKIKTVVKSETQATIR
jgi:uncharacterized OsmC-like protein